MMVPVPPMQQSGASYLLNLYHDLREILRSGRPLQGGAEGLRTGFSPQLSAPGLVPFSQSDSSSKWGLSWVCLS